MVAPSQGTTMYEVEVKVRAAHDPVRERLAALGADHVGTLAQADTYYDHPCRAFVETDEALRIRRERERSGHEPGVRLTYKGPLVEQASKTREEHETGVEDGEAMAAVLDELGFDPVATVEKNRDRYDVDGYRVTLDDVADLGSFVEVETTGAREAVEALREGAYEILRRLDLDPTDQIRTSYLELLLEGAGSTPTERHDQ